MDNWSNTQIKQDKVNDLLKRTTFFFIFFLFIVLLPLGCSKLTWLVKNKPVSPSVVLAADKGNKSQIITKVGNIKVIAYRFQTLRPGFLEYVSLRFGGKAYSVEIRKGEEKPDESKEDLLASSKSINGKEKKWVGIKFNKRPFLSSEFKYWILVKQDKSKDRFKSKAFSFKIYTQRDINAISLDKKITINFFPVEGSDSYNIYRSNDSKKGWKKIASTSDLGYTDEGLINGKKYYYSVTAESGGVESKKSRAVSVIPTLKKIPSIQWKQPLYSNGYGEFPLLYKGDKFIGAGSNVYRFQADTGRLKKIYKLIDDKTSFTENFNVPGQGVITKINGEESLIWAAFFRYSTIDLKRRTSKTKISAIRLFDGKKIWSKTVRGSFMSEGLVADKGKVFMPTNNYGLYSFDSQNGRTKVITKIHSASVPIVDGNYIYIGSSRMQKNLSGLYKIDKRKGNFTLAEIGENVIAGFSSPILVNDSYIGKKIIFTSVSGRIFLIDFDKFNKQWSFVSHYGIKEGSINGAGAYHQGRFYIAISDSIFALDLTKNPKEKGFIIWEKAISNRGAPVYVSGAVTLTKNVLYGRGTRLTSIGRSTKDIVVFALNPEIGKELWLMTFKGKSGFICSNPWPYGGLLNLDRAWTPDMADPGYSDYALKVSENTEKIDLLEYRGNKYHHGYIDLNQ